MAQYIDKDALVAEIERLITPECGYSMNKLLDFIESLEVKEVDFEKELDRIWFDNKFGDMFDNSAVDFANVREICRHFFELGLKAHQENNVIGTFEREVKIDAGGYPYIDCDIEFYDYDKDIPLAKEGDKVKVIVIKEE